MFLNFIKKITNIIVPHTDPEKKIFTFHPSQIFKEIIKWKNLTMRPQQSVLDTSGYTLFNGKYLVVSLMYCRNSNTKGLFSTKTCVTLEDTDVICPTVC